MPQRSTLPGTSTTREAAFRVPAEWEPRAGTLLAWPLDRGGTSAALIETIEQVLALLRACEPVTLLVPPDDREELARALGGEDETLRLEPFAVNDIWTRDTGPMGAYRAGDGEAIFLDGNFNGWGEQHPYEMDRLLPTVLGRRWGRARVRLPLTVEGGAVEVNGRGDLLTTEAVLLDPRRHNPGRAEVERALEHYLGAARVHWLPRGLAGDDTGGHIDNLARFVGPRCIVCPGDVAGSDHPDAELFRETRRTLMQLELAAGAPEVVALPVPSVRTLRGQPLPASYANFYLAEGLVLVPQFGDDQDDRALGVMRELFADRRVAGVQARPLLAQGGALHCITQPLLHERERR
jgi:agmatine deiminase